MSWACRAPGRSSSPMCRSTSRVPGLLARRLFALATRAGKRAAQRHLETTTAFCGMVARGDLLAAVARDHLAGAAQDRPHLCDRRRVGRRAIAPGRARNRASVGAAAARHVRHDGDRRHRRPGRRMAGGWRSASPDDGMPGPLHRGRRTLPAQSGQYPRLLERPGGDRRLVRRRFLHPLRRYRRGRPRRIIPRRRPQEGHPDHQRRQEHRAGDRRERAAVQPLYQRGHRLRRPAQIYHRADRDRFRERRAMGAAEADRLYRAHEPRSEPARHATHRRRDRAAQRAARARGAGQEVSHPAQGAGAGRRRHHADSQGETRARLQIVRPTRGRDVRRGTRGPSWSEPDQRECKQGAARCSGSHNQWP